MTSLSQLTTVAKQIRRDVLMATTIAGSGHPSSCLSSVEAMVALFFGGVLRADLRRPQLIHNDVIIFSKGHAAPLLYALYAAAKVIPATDLRRLRKFGSEYEGHPTMAWPYTTVPTGSLGQGLSQGLGMAIANVAQRSSAQTYVLLGDSEMAEGQVWEAIQLAGHRRVGSLTAILDVNRLGQRGPTMLGHRVDDYAKRIRAFGWQTIVVDGHDLAALLEAYRKAQSTKNKPTMIIARTIKGQSVPLMENREGWHGRVLSREALTTALKAIAAPPGFTVVKVLPPRRGKTTSWPTGRSPQPKYALDQSTSVRAAIGHALTRLAPRIPKVIVLDAEVSNSTMTEKFAKAFPKRFVESYIAEQNMVSMAAGLASRGLVPVAATFSAFLTRAFDQLRMAAYAGTPQVYIGTHPGVSIGQDGPSQMGLEDLAMFRTLQDSTVLYPSDAMSAERLTELALRQPHLTYLRATRGETPILYGPRETFRVGGSKVLRRSPHDRATIVTAGITVFTALEAANILLDQGIHVRVIDVYSIKPIDRATLLRAAKETSRMIVVEDHRPEGGIADAVRIALGSQANQVVSLAVGRMPRSGRPEQLLRFEHLDVDAIVRAVVA